MPRKRYAIAVYGYSTTIQRGLTLRQAKRIVKKHNKQTNDIYKCWKILEAVDNENFANYKGEKK